MFTRLKALAGPAQARKRFGFDTYFWVVFGVLEYVARGHADPDMRFVHCAKNAKYRAFVTCEEYAQ